MLHYLPLAHVLEYIVELAFLYLGTTCGYGTFDFHPASVQFCMPSLVPFHSARLIDIGRATASPPPRPRFLRHGTAPFVQPPSELGRAG